jgi:hypothetical protein
MRRRWTVAFLGIAAIGVSLWVFASRRAGEALVPVCANVDLDWLLDKMPADQCRRWDGVRVTATGDAADPFWGVAPYQLYFHYQVDHPWFTGRPLRIVPVTGDPVPQNRDRVTVRGVLHVAWQGGSEAPQFTLTADGPASTPATPHDEPFSVLSLFGLLPLMGFPLLLIVGAHRMWFVRRLSRRRPGVCLHCGYDLRGIADCCPECGRERVGRVPFAEPAGVHGADWGTKSSAALGSPYSYGPRYTVGMRSKFHAAGGHVVLVHSSVVARQGLFPAFRPHTMLPKKFTISGSCASPSTNALIVMNWFIGCRCANDVYPV